MQISKKVCKIVAAQKVSVPFPAVPILAFVPVTFHLTIYTMSLNFVGRFVSASMKDGNTIQGTVQRVGKGELVLSNVYFVESQSSLPVFTLNAVQIADIKVMPPAQSQQHSAQQHAFAQNTIPVAPVAHQVPSSYVAPGRESPDLNKNKKKENKKKENGRKNYHDRHHNHQDDWDSDIKSIQTSEFDFQANLDMFDKASVFEEIKKHDQVDPGARLHSHNTIEKYGNKEMVIDNQKLRLEQQQAAPRINRVYSSSPSIRGRRAVMVNGVLVPLISPLQRVELDNLMVDKRVSQTENAGRGIAHVILQALGGSARFSPTNHNASPVVVILGGGALSKTANSRAVAMTQFLQNRGIIVYHWKHGVAQSPAANGPIDLIVDAISGIEADPDEDIDPATKELTDWANDIQNRRVPVVAIDVPCPWITKPPRIIVSCGLPSTAIPPQYTEDPSTTSTTTHYIVDVNIPQDLLADRFARFKSLYFGADFVVKAIPVPPQV